MNSRKKHRNLLILLVLAFAGVAAAVAITQVTARADGPAESLIGKSAPDFSLMSDQDVRVSLADFKGKQRVLLAFFPKAFTPG